MSELDATLGRIWLANVNACMHLLRDDRNPPAKVMAEFEERIATEIKQAFKEYGWSTPSVMDLRMDGKDWYERFSKEVGALSHTQSRQFIKDPARLYGYMIDAAKKASGIEQIGKQDHLIGVFGGLLPDSPIPKREWCVWCGKLKSEIKDEEKCEGIEQ